jgi:XTP/dITP diphosphohydrolase
MKPPRYDKLVLATNNRHKVKEITAILKKAGVKLKILTLDDFPKRKPVVENKPTLEGNAIKKATEIATFTGCLALSDDTGLFVDAIQGRPGVYSARFAGPGCTFQDNNQKILRLLKKQPWGKRGATFRCVAALVTSAGRTQLAQGRIRGKIALDVQGAEGFGYDPIFYVPRYKKTFAEIGVKLKNKISHRALAFQKVARLIRRRVNIP